MLRQKIDTLLVAGDIFDKAVPDQSVKDSLLTILLDYPEINFVFAVGNHDFETKSYDYHSLMTYKVLGQNVDNVVVLSDWPVTSWSWKTIRELTFVSLPSNTDWLRGKNVALKHCSKLSPKLVAIWHGILPGLDLRTYDTTVCRTLVNDFLQDYNVNYLALGDIHKQLRINSACYYPGTLTPKTFACEPGFLVVDIEDSAVSVQPHSLATLGLPPRVVLDLLVAENDTEKFIAEQIVSRIPEGCVLRLNFQMTMSAWGQLDKKILVDLLSDHCLSVKVHNNPVLEKRTREGIQCFRTTQSLMEELNFLVDQTDIHSRLNRKELLAVCQQIADKIEAME